MMTKNLYVVANVKQLRT